MMPIFNFKHTAEWMEHQLEKINNIEINKADKDKVYTKEETDSIIINKVSEIIANAPEDFDTLKEMSDWLIEHEDDAAEMNTNIIKNSNDIKEINNTLYPVGKNLLKNTAIDATINGITFTVNMDKSVTCNGTATANAFFILGRTFRFSGSAILSGAPIGGGSSRWSIQVYEIVDGIETIRVNDYGETNTRTYTEGDYLGKIVIREGQTVNDLTFYPMLRLSSENETYEPYKPSVEEQLEILNKKLFANL